MSNENLGVDFTYIISENNMVLRDLHLVVFLNVPPYSELGCNTSQISNPTPNKEMGRGEGKEEKFYFIPRRKSSIDK